MYSETYGPVSVEDAAQHIKDYVQKSERYKLYIGTDSQIYPSNKTKIVSVIAVHNIGHGGIFFYDIKLIKRLETVRQKLVTETQYSLDLVESLLNAFDTIEFDYTNIDISIHVDAGNNGPSKNLIQEITGWIHAHGYECDIKPKSICASSIANKYSK